MRAIATVLALASVAVFCLVGTASATEADPTFSCGIQQGPTWRVPGGRTGHAWYAIAIQTRNECANANDWASRLGQRVTSRGTTDVSAFVLNGYGCIIVRSQLFGACRVGNGGHGTDGVILLGNPSQNPYVGLYNGTYNPSAQQTVAALKGVPGPTATSLCKQIAGPRWSFRAPDGHQVSGVAWQVVGDSFPDGCAAADDLRIAMAKAAGNETMNTRSFLASGRMAGDWGCVAAHDYAWPGGSNTISGVPVAGCARVIYPFGTGVSGALEQLVLIPDLSTVTEAARANPPTGVTTAVQQQVNDMRRAAGRHGVGVVAAVGAAARVVGGSHPETNARTSTAVEQCGRQRVGGGAWRHGSARGDAWLVAVKGGYPCELAKAIFVPFLAYLDTLPETALAGADLSRYGWTCRGNRAALTATCTFNADGVLQDAVAHPIPNGMRVAVSAAWSGGAGALATAIQG